VHSLVGQTTSIGELAGAFVLGAIAEFSSIQLSLVLAAFFFATAGLMSTKAIDR